MNGYMETVLHVAELERAVSEMHDIEHALKEGRADIEMLKTTLDNCRIRFALWSDCVDVLGAHVSRELDAIRHQINDNRPIIHRTTTED
jgi:hypothetical protein